MSPHSSLKLLSFEACSGIRWRDLPPQFSTYQIRHRRFHRTGPAGVLP
ncbi:MAG: hypothetical protein C4293_10900 [Nitrospiraceae bacterium]